MVPNEALHILNLQREDNLFIKDNMSGPKVSFVWKFNYRERVQLLYYTLYCTLYNYLLVYILRISCVC